MALTSSRPGSRSHQVWRRHALAVVVAILASCGTSAGGGRTAPPPQVHASSPLPASLLVWLPVHASEPDEHVQSAVACLFQRWRPSLAGRRFDVLVTVAGTAANVKARAASAASIVNAGTRHIQPAPSIAAQHVTLDSDAYDIDEAHGRQSSYAGPNEVFYRGMILAESTAESGAIDPAHAPSSAPPSASVPTPSLSARLAQYAFVQVLETDCCATADGWLDALLQPMLDDDRLLISGSKGRGACWTGREHGGCKPTVDPATPHAHLRNHINGNAMYRVGRDLSELAAAARDRLGPSVPFDVAMFLVGAANERAADNARAYSVMGLPVDGSRFADRAYYGGDHPDLALVHAPRRLRVQALQAVLRRLDAGHPVTVVLVGPAGGLDQDRTLMLRHVHGGLFNTGEIRNTLFLVADEAGHAAASQLAPMRVVMAAGGAGERSGGAGERRHDQAIMRYDDAWHAVLSTLAALARAGLATFTIGLEATILHPYTPHLAALLAEQHGTVWVMDCSSSVGPPPSMVGAHDEAGRRHAADDRNWRPGAQNVGMLLAPATEQAAVLMERWAARALDGSSPRFGVAALQRLEADRQVGGMAVLPLPPDLFPPASSYVGPLWTGAARRAVAAVVGWDGGMGDVPAVPATLSAVGLWSPPSVRFRTACANHSVLASRPLPMTNMRSVHRSLVASAAFDRFVRRHAIACIILPGFRLGTPGNIVPARAVLETGSDAMVFTSQADLDAAGGGGDLVPFELAAARLQDQEEEEEDKGAKGGSVPRPPQHAGTACFTPGLARLIADAAAALPPLFTCLVDFRRNAHDLALLALEGRLGDVLAEERGAPGPALLTGAWRHARVVEAGGLPAGGGPPSTLTLPSLPSRWADPMARLVRFGPPLVPSAPSSPWSDVLEYAVCQGAARVRWVGQGSGGEEEDAATATPRRNTHHRLLAHLASRIPPAVLDADLAELARWLARPDRAASLTAAQTAQLVLTDAAVGADDFQDAVLAPALGLARAAGADLAILPCSGGLPWAAIIGEAKLRQAHADHVTLLPASVGRLLISQEEEALLDMRSTLHPASVDIVRAPHHAVAVRALKRALAFRDKAARPISIFSATASVAQHRRLGHFGAGAAHVAFTF